MRLFSPAYREDQLTPVNARTLLIVNLVACPGVGTIMAGRRVGYLQAAAMLVGFSLMLVFVTIYFKGVVHVLGDPYGTEEQWWTLLRRASWLGIAGMGLCGIAWVWGLATGLSLLRAAKARERKPPIGVEP